MQKLTPQALGMLLALYEHKVFVQNTVWGINAFDQPGVELGKRLATRILPHVDAKPPPGAYDASTTGLIAFYQANRRGRNCLLYFAAYFLISTEENRHERRSFQHEHPQIFKNCRRTLTVRNRARRRRGNRGGRLKGKETFPARMQLKIDAIGLDITLDGEIKLE